VGSTPLVGKPALSKEELLEKLTQLNTPGEKDGGVFSVDYRIPGLE